MSEINNKIKESAVELLDFVNNSKDFVVEQAPLYVQELVHYHYIENLTSLVLNSILLLVSVLVSSILSYKVWKRGSDWDEYWEAHVLVYVGAISLVVVIISCITIPSSFKECYKAKETPRVLIVEKLNKLR